MSTPPRQYLRADNRHRAQSALYALPGWHRVQLAGNEPAEIRTVEQLLTWLEAYGRELKGEGPGPITKAQRVDRLGSDPRRGRG